MTVTATPDTLQAVLAKAVSGTIKLAGGYYGDVSITKLSGKVITLKSASLSAPASFRSLTVSDSSKLTFSGLYVEFKPDAKTVGWTAAVTVQRSNSISFTGCTIKGGLAVNGVAEDATELDNTSNVIGRPCGYGLNLVQSQKVAFSDGEISGFHRLVVVNNIDGFTCQNNSLHNRRTTAIQGAQLSNAVIENNTIDDAEPWRWGQTPVGDHADCIAFWSNPKQTTPNANISIRNNRMMQTKGATILGMWLQGSDAAPFDGFDISANTFLIPNLQGVALWNAKNGTISGNVMVQSQVPGMTDEQRQKQKPTVLLRLVCSNVQVRDNLLGAPVSDTNAAGLNPQSGNVVLTGQVAA